MNHRLATALESSERCAPDGSYILRSATPSVDFDTLDSCNTGFRVEGVAASLLVIRIVYILNLTAENQPHDDSAAQRVLHPQGFESLRAQIFDEGPSALIWLYSMRTRSCMLGMGRTPRTARALERNDPEPQNPVGSYDAGSRDQAARVSMHSSTKALDDINTPPPKLGSPRPKDLKSQGPRLPRLLRMKRRGAFGEDGTTATPAPASATPPPFPHRRGHGSGCSQEPGQIPVA